MVLGGNSASQHKSANVSCYSSEDERPAVLFMAVDYKLIAGPLSFLHRVFPDFSVQNREFIELKNEELSRPHFVGYEQALDTATRFMDWLD